MKLGRIYNAVEPDGFLLIPLSTAREKFLDTIWALMYHWGKEMWLVDNFEHNAYFGPHYSLQFSPREIKKIPWGKTTAMPDVVKHQVFRAVFR
jgi:hypothetical protein